MRYRDLKTIDQQIAEHQAEMKQYRGEVTPYDDLEVILQCRYCDYEISKTVGWLRDGNDFTGVLRTCAGCGRQRSTHDHNFMHRLIEDFKQQGPKALVLRL